MRVILCFFGLVLGCVLLVVYGCGGQIEYPSLDPSVASELQAWLDSNGKSPADYVLGKFDDHDVVILGEPHRLRDHPLLVQELIPQLPEHGVHVLATEFARVVDQHLIDSLLNAPVWHEELAIEIQLRQYSLWPWREYLDIFKVAWQYNRSISSDQIPFEIVGLNCAPDWSVFETREDLDISDKRREAWGGCTEADWASVALKEVNSGEKVLAFCGMHHAFSGYTQPRVNGDGEFLGFEEGRFGNHLRDSLGGQVFTIALHQLWYERTSQYSNANLRPVDGAIDAVMELRADSLCPVGFDVVGSPFGELTDRNAIYAVGYDHFTLSTYCDGYVYFDPFSESKVVTFIEGYYNESNIDVARVSVSQPQYRDATPEYFEERTKRQLERQQARMGGL